MTGTRTRIEGIEHAQLAAGAGVRRVAAVLSTASDERGHLVADRATPETGELIDVGDDLTAERLRSVLSDELAEWNANAAEGTTVESGGNENGRLTPGEPIVVGVTPRREGYHGRLVRTFVVGGDGGKERRAAVALDGAFRSAKALVTAREVTVGAVEGDLAAEIRAFGFDEDDGIETWVHGVGAETRENPREPGDAIEPGTVVAVEAAVDGGGERRIRFGDLLVRGTERARWIDAPPRSLDPSAVSPSKGG